MTKLEYCSHCGAPTRFHPITKAMVDAEPFSRVCMIDYAEQTATPLPFGLTALTDDDKLDLQDYWQRLPRQ